MPEARAARQKDRCPWLLRLAHVTIMFGIICTAWRKQDVCVLVKDGVKPLCPANHR